MMNLLAFETSSSMGTVALSSASGLSERAIATPREQTDLMLPLVDELLREANLRLADLDAIVFGRGPGSFTGLRVSAALAQGLALAADLPVITVSSLQALAQRAWRELGITTSLACVDARMGEVYSAGYAVRDGRAYLVGEERLGSPESVALPSATAWSGPWAAIGNGCAAHADALAPLLAAAERLVPDLLPAARDLLPQAVEDFEAGRLLTPETALPVYLRNEDAWHR